MLTTDQRLEKLENKVDNMQTDLTEIKAGVKFANAAAKAIGSIIALVLAYMALH